jgi:hypothetical protein
MIKAIVVGELDVLEGAEAMELGIRIATETEYKYVWHRDMTRLVLGNVPWRTIPDSGPSMMYLILSNYEDGSLGIVGTNESVIHVRDWGQEVVI